MLGIDFGYGKIKGSVIKNSGFSFVMRYLSHSPDKNLTKDELKDLISSGLQVGVVWETTVHRPLEGEQAGIDDANSALSMLNSLGVSGTIYFACDDDFNPNQFRDIGSYFSGVLQVLSKDQVGIYGGYNIVKYILDQGLVDYAWQTYAWSHGQWDTRAQLRQIDIYGPKLEGVNCDTNQSISDDFGQLK